MSNQVAVIAGAIAALVLPTLIPNLQRVVHLIPVLTLALLAAPMFGVSLALPALVMPALIGAALGASLARFVRG